MKPKTPTLNEALVIVYEIYGELWDGRDGRLTPLRLKVKRVADTLIAAGADEQAVVAFLKSAVSGPSDTPATE